MADEVVYSEFAYSTGSKDTVYYVKHSPVKENQDGIWGIAYAVKGSKSEPGSGSNQWIPGGYFGFHDMKFYRTITTRHLPKHLKEKAK